MKESQVSWTIGTRHGTLSIGAHRLYLSASGPTRQSTNGILQPAVIIEAGLCSGEREWIAVERLIAEKARVYAYDRAGYGRSDPSPDPLTAENRIMELTHLLENANVEPPYVLVGHSYGGVLVREFLRQHGKEKVAGMVIVDSSRVRTPLPSDWPSLVGDSEYPAIVGLDKNHVLSTEEYEAVKEDGHRNLPTAQLEESFMVASTEKVNDAIPEGPRALGDNRLSVIFGNESIDFQKLYDFGIAHGFGTKQAQDNLARRLEDMEKVDEQGQRAHLQMSSQSRFVYARGDARTHNLQYVAPEVIRDEVFWVLGLSDD
ncbi:hypothetical protein N7478_012008 [Penicillium angulare]|uniref:uncharacterized protein n=1 Tax=Penicillium angulare TaxID=116970 RepID=UPI002540B49E|nr:uncharacterized protein N7478_012008 [Penicillium angulare]KAJ5261413.1 hypothetical protein N7478_012008 [Penicillium angulare]